MRRRNGYKAALVPALLAAAFGAALAHAAPGDRPTPYWASIAAGQARMRTGPGRNFPASWLYRRADLPVKVLEIVPNWRKIRDPEGAEGWVMVNLLSDRRTALVTGSERPLRAGPDRGAPVRWRAQPGVVGRISECSNGWCHFDVHGREGYIETAHIWGVDPNEAVE